MKLGRKHYIGVAIGVVAILISSIFLWGSKLFYFILVISGIVILLPFVVDFILEMGVQNKKDERFLEFVRDLVENVKSGTPVSKSIVNLKTRGYGALNKHVEKLANQISLGIPLTKALNNFAMDINSRVVTRAISLISEAEKAGGQIETVLESVSRSVNQTQELKKEQRAAVYGLIVQGYIIFFVFILIMIVLQFQILPMTAEVGTVDDLSLKVRAMNPEEFSQPLFILLLVQSLFAGLVIGKISEGTFKQGIKHSFILVALGLLISTGANAFLG